MLSLRPRTYGKKTKTTPTTTVYDISDARTTTARIRTTLARDIYCSYGKLRVFFSNVIIIIIIVHVFFVAYTLRRVPGGFHAVVSTKGIQRCPGVRGGPTTCVLASSENGFHVGGRAAEQIGRYRGRAIFRFFNRDTPACQSYRLKSRRAPITRMNRDPYSSRRVFEPVLLNLIKNHTRKSEWTR